MKGKIALVGGDGIGPEVVGAAVAVLDKTGRKFGHSFEYAEALAGGRAIDETGEPLPRESIRVCRESDAVLFGAVGGPQWDDLPGHLRPERAILGLRKKLGLYANLRPARLCAPLGAASPLRADIAGKGIDLLIVRELTGGIYYGERGRIPSENGTEAFDTERYSEREILRIGVCAFEFAGKRRKRLVSVDKANVLESSRLWRETMHALRSRYPDVEYEDMLVDNAAMQLVRCPAQFDVLVTSNLFGDILSDEASVLTGSIGLLPSASMGEGSFGLYEPIHGSAPAIAGRGKANPIAAILAGAMMLRYSFSLEKEARRMEEAVDAALDSGLRTEDIAENARPAASTEAMTARILDYI
jgi:3-isopropylmalate dehydrogenase